MPTIVNRVIGTFKLGDEATGIALEAQMSTIGVPQTVTRDAAVTVLTGDIVQAAATYSWSIVGTVILDYTDPQGAYYFVNTHQGETLAFEFCPSGPTAGPTISGLCIVDGWNTEELNAGSNAVSKFTWPIQGDITIVPPA